MSLIKKIKSLFCKHEWVHNYPEELPQVFYIKDDYEGWHTSVQYKYRCDKCGKTIFRPYNPMWR